MYTQYLLYISEKSPVGVCHLVRARPWKKTPIRSRPKGPSYRAKGSMPCESKKGRAAESRVSGCEKGTTIVYSTLIQQLLPIFSEFNVRAKFHLIWMWVKQCHKPPHFGWFIPPIKIVILWIVYDCFNHITQNIHKEHGKHRKIVRVKPSFVSLSGSFCFWRYRLLHVMTHGEKTLKAVPFRKTCPECQLCSSVFDHWDGILISQGSVKFQQHSALGIIPKIDKQVTMDSVNDRVEQ